VLVKKLEDGAIAVGLFNIGKETVSVKVTWKQLGIDGTKTIRDLWRQKNIGTYDSEFEAMVRPHGVILVKIMPAAK
jgi:alpha-galactosidase